MNLQENINRIHQMMGIINENKIVKMINDLGLPDAIRYLGGYDNLKNMLGDYNIPRTEKIKGIVERIIEFNQSIGEDENGGFWLTDNGSEPIEYEGLNNNGLRDDYQQIEVLYRDGVIVYGYRDTSFVSGFSGSFELNYEDLSDEKLDEILNTIMT